MMATDDENEQAVHLTVYERNDTELVPFEIVYLLRRIALEEKIPDVLAWMDTNFSEGNATGGFYPVKKTAIVEFFDHVWAYEDHPIFNAIRTRQARVWLEDFSAITSESDSQESDSDSQESDEMDWTENNITAPENDDDKDKHDFSSDIDFQKKPSKSKTCFFPYSDSSDMAHVSSSAPITASENLLASSYEEYKSTWLPLGEPVMSFDTFALIIKSSREPVHKAPQ